MTTFESLYNQYFIYACPPSEGNKAKIFGCYNKVNDYGKKPVFENCLKCWKDELKKILSFTCTDCNGDQL